MKRATIDREAFFRMVSFDPHPGQRRLIDGFLPEYGGKRFAAAACGVRWGKDYCVAHIMAAAMIAPNEHEFVGWVVGPLLNLSDIGFGYVCSIFTNYFPEMVVSVKSHDGVLEIKNLANKPARLYRRTAERGAVALTGSSCDLIWLLEGSAIDSALVEQSIMTRLVDRRGSLISVSTPRGVSGYFPEMVRRGIAGSEDTFAMRSPSWENDRLDRRDLFRMKQRMRPAAWQQEVEAKFISFQGACFDAEVVRRQCRAAPGKPDPNAVFYGGYDIAQNRDFNVLVVGRREDDGSCTVVYADRWHKLDTDATVARVVRTCRKFQLSGLAADATGAGKPLCDLLRGKGVAVTPVVLTQQSKATLVANLGNLLDQNRLVGLAPEHCPEMAHELTLYQFTNETGTSSAAPVGSHDDVPLALALLGSWFRPGAGGAPRAIVRGQSIDTGAQDEDDDGSDVEQPAEPEDSGDIRGDAVPRAQAPRRAPFGLGLGFRVGSLGMRWRGR